MHTLSALPPEWEQTLDLRRRTLIVTEETL
jgi:hypothetical protein